MAVKEFDFWTLAPWPSVIQVSVVLLTHRLLTWSGQSQGLYMHRTTQTKNGRYTSKPCVKFRLTIAVPVSRRYMPYSRAEKPMTCGINCCSKFLFCPTNPPV